MIKFCHNFRREYMHEEKIMRTIKTARANLKLALLCIKNGENVDAMAYLIEVLCGLMPIVYIKDLNDISKEDYEIACKMFNKANALKKEIAFILKEENGKRI